MTEYLTILMFIDDDDQSGAFSRADHHWSTFSDFIVNLRGALGMLRPSPTDTEGVTQAMGQEAMRAIHKKWVAKYGPMTTDKVSFFLIILYD
tara:strand:+ start:315 stop:590 length:276 start_codon:yes stop_codon:yes gene_type:complete